MAGFKPKSLIHNWIRKTIRENKYHHELQSMLEEENLEKTILGFPYDKGFIKIISTKVQSILDFCHEKERTLSDVIRFISPEVANVYQLPERSILNTFIFPSLKYFIDAMYFSVATIINSENLDQFLTYINLTGFTSDPLKAAMARIISVDAGRAGPIAPPSAYVPIDVYFGSGKGVTEAELLFDLREERDGIQEKGGDIVLNPRAAIELGQIREVLKDTLPTEDSIIFYGKDLPAHLMTTGGDLSTFVIGKPFKPFHQVKSFTIGNTIQDNNSFLYALFPEGEKASENFTVKRKEAYDSMRTNEDYRKYMLPEIRSYYSQLSGEELEAAPRSIKKYLQDFEENIVSDSPKGLASAILKYSERYIEPTIEKLELPTQPQESYGFAEIIARIRGLSVECYRRDPQTFQLKYVYTIGDDARVVSILMDGDYFYPLFVDEDG